MAISGFFLRFALVSREVADGTAFVLALQLWPWRSDDGGLWINLTTTLCLCVCVYVGSVHHCLGQKVVLGSQTYPGHSVLASGRSSD